jgi:hypothetical protein
MLQKLADGAGIIGSYTIAVLSIVIDANYLIGIISSIAGVLMTFVLIWNRYQEGLEKHEDVRAKRIKNDREERENELKK